MDDDFEMNDSGSQNDDADLKLSIPLGGPIYVPNLISALTSVSEFETLAFQYLQELEVELDLGMVSSPVCDEDLSVDELKVLTEEELVDRALKEAFKDDNLGDCSSQPRESNPGIGEFTAENTTPAHTPKDGGTSTSLKSTRQSCRNRSVNTYSSRGRPQENDSVHDNDGVGCSSQPGESNLNERMATREAAFETHVEGVEGTSNSKKLAKPSRRKRRSRKRMPPNDGCYLAKVEEIAKLKLKQEEDKAAARLHSFNGSRTMNESASPSVEKIESLMSLKSMGTAKRAKASHQHEHIPVLSPEVVLSVEIYHNRRTWSKTQEFLVLGQQTLTELRDSIYCMTDQIMEKEGHSSPSGYFLIEDVFFNDLRDTYATDYSKPIIKWLKNSKHEVQKKWEFIISGDLQKKQKAVLGDMSTSNLPYFSAQEMLHTRFCDLKFRLGASYLYCHQGKCKHTIVIRDMRLVHPDDVQNRAAYPILTFQLKPRFQKCAVCKTYRARKVTIDDKWASTNPCYFCNQCYQLLHFSIDGVPLYGGYQTFDFDHE